MSTETFHSTDLAKPDDDAPFTPPRSTNASRKITLRSKGSLRGSMVTANGTPRQLTYESAIERNTAQVLLARPDVIRLEDQPPAVAIVHPDGRLGHHTFDFLVHLKDGRRLAVAVKDEARASKHDLDGFLRHIAPQIPKDFADGVVLVTEQRLSPVEISNARLIHSVRRDPPNPADAVVRELIMTTHGEVRIGDLVTASGRGADAFRAIVRLIADGDIVLTDHQRVSYTSQIAVSSRTNEEAGR